MAKSEKAIAETALKRFKYASEAWAPQRRREVEDLRFQDPDQQWTAQAVAERRGGVSGGEVTPARPMVSISKLNQPYQLIRNQQRQARLGVNLHPRSPEANPETAQVIQGIYRSIEQESRADQGRGWAFARAAWAGWGCYRITTDYDDEGGHPFDQVIRIERILYQDAVYFDPSARLADFSDATYAFVVEFVPIDKFKALYPKAKVPDPTAAPFDWDRINSVTPEWVRFDGENRAVMVAEYWYKEYETQTFVEMSEDAQAAGFQDVEIEEELPEDMSEELKPDKEARRRKHLVPTVWFCKLAPGGDPLQHLEGPQEWNGQYIPLVPVFGEELQPFDSQRRYVGMVYANRDAQRGYNFAASTLLERMALEPKAPFMIDPEQIAEYKDQWQQANRRNFPYLPYRRFLNGNDYGAPQRAGVDMTGSSLAVLGLQQFNDFLQSGTFAYDPSLGQGQPQRSGKAIMAEQQQFELSSSGYLYNLADVSMNYEARIILDLIPKIYDRPGRIARVLDEEDQTEMVALNAPFVDGPDGLPMPMNGQPPPPGAEVKQYDLTKGVYSVSITVGKSFQTLRQEGSETLGEIITTRPEMLPVLGPLWLKMQDFPGAQEMKDIMVKWRDAQFPFLAGDGKQGSPEQIAAENQQLKMQMEQMGQQLQMATQALETKQVEQQGTLAKAQMDNETKLVTAKMAEDNKLQIELLRQQMEQIRLELKGNQDAELQRQKTAGDMAKTVTEAALKPPDLTYKGSADRPLPKGERF